jgi:hypothetical protein
MVEGLVIMTAATSPLWRAQASRTVSAWRSPSAPVLSGTVSNWFSVQLAGFVPWAESGTRTLRGRRPWSSW